LLGCQKKKNNKKKKKKNKKKKQKKQKKKKKKKKKPVHTTDLHRPECFTRALSAPPGAAAQYPQAFSPGRLRGERVVTFGATCRRNPAVSAEQAVCVTQETLPRPCYLSRT
jgi:hypothetical protein